MMIYLASFLLLLSLGLEEVSLSVLVFLVEVADFFVEKVQLTVVVASLLSIDASPIKPEKLEQFFHIV